MLKPVTNNEHNSAVVLYGAGNNAGKSIELLKSEGYTNILCFTDTNINLHFNTLLGYDILPLHNILKKNELDNLFFYVTPDGEAKKEIYEALRKSAVEDRQIINCQEWEYKRGCTFLENLCVVSERYLRLCYIFYANTACKYSVDDYVVYGNPYDEETISAFMRFRNERARNIALNLPSPCNDCQFIETKTFLREKKIRYVNTIISNPCNLKCIYCVIHDKNPTEENVHLACKFYIGTFIKSLQKANAIPDRIFLDIAAGEYSLLTEQQKDDILSVSESFVGAGQILTNAVQYDLKLEYTLRNNRHIDLHTVVSLDAGTPETYHAVKGVDVYETVCKNVKRYVTQGCGVMLKYVFLPQNSNKKDVDGFINFCMEVQKISKETLVIILTRDLGYYGADLGEMIYFISEMYSRLKSLGFLIQVQKWSFTIEQCDQILALADTK